MFGDHSLQADTADLGEIVPILRWDLSYATNPEYPGLEDEETEYRFEGITRDCFSRIVTRFDARRNLRSIAEATGEHIDLVIDTYKSLAAVGLAVNLSSARTEVSPQALFHVCQGVFPRWKNRLFSHSLWQSLTQGRASRPQFMGWLMETYHFIEGVNDRMALAIADCPDSEMQSVFAHHYSEEWDHGEFFMRPLKLLGLSDAQIFNSRPLPGTLAVLNHMRHCARRDPLQYAVCSGFLESTGTDRARAIEFFERVTKHYAPDHPEVIAPMIEHIRLDEAYEHGDFLAENCGKLGPLNVERANRALAAGALLVETLELWSSDILKSYDVDEFVPRTNLHGYRKPSGWQRASVPLTTQGAQS